MTDGSTSVHTGDSFSFVISEKDEGVRFDRYLTLRLAEISRSQINNSIKKSSILINNLEKKSSYKLKAGDKIEGIILISEPVDVVPEKIPLNILYEDHDILVLCKPPDMVVHPGAGNINGTLVNGLVNYCNSMEGVGGDQLRPGIVHRLDKDTSGVMVVAKTHHSHAQLTKAFKERTVVKQYHAIVHGVMCQEEGRMVAGIKRHPVDRKKMCVTEHGGKYAVTNWIVEQEFAKQFSLLRLHIETGRTHQIRVHMQYLGNPIAGDKVYGYQKDQKLFSRQMLHASSLKLQHPVTGRKMKFNAPLFPDFHEKLEELEMQYSEYQD